MDHRRSLAALGSTLLLACGPEMGAPGARPLAATRAPVPAAALEAPAGSGARSEPPSVPASLASPEMDVSLSEPSFNTLDPPGVPGALAPAWAVGAAVPTVSWLEPTEGGGHRLRLSTLQSGSWSAPTTIFEGDSFFANWADVPGVAFGGGGGAWAHWLEKSGSDTYAYSIALARSDDGGRGWRRAGFLHDDAVAAEHGFVSWLREGSALRAVWLDGRAMPSGGAMTLRSALVGAGGPAAGEVLDDRVCECCATSATSTQGGPLVAYRDRSAEEVRDIALITGAGGGWSAPRVAREDRWKIPGCPVNGPSLDARGRQVVLAWFTGEPSARVQAMFSSDAGASFGAPVLLDDRQPLGRIQTALLDGTHAAISWLSESGGEAELRLARVGVDATVSRVLTVARTNASRSSGVPRLFLDGDRLLVAWLDTPADRRQARLRVSAVPLSAFER